MLWATGDVPAMMMSVISWRFMACINALRKRTSATTGGLAFTNCGQIFISV